MQQIRRPQIAPLLQVPINQLFIPRPSLVYWEPMDCSFEHRKGIKIEPTSRYVHLMEKPEEESGEIVEIPQSESVAERQVRLKNEKIAKNNTSISQQLPYWNPNGDPKIDRNSDPYKTVIVANLSYETNERKLCREFEQFGPIRMVRIIRNSLTGKPRGYAFVEYEREKDMRCAFRDGNGMKIDGRRVVVDIERGRTQKGWKPRRFGGGLGNSRVNKLKL